MTAGKALNGKPYAGNPHVRFDEGEVALAATPRRGSLLYKKLLMMIGAAADLTAKALAAVVAVGAMLPMSAKAADVYWTGSGDSALLSDSGNWGATINVSSDRVFIGETTDEKTPVVPDGTTKYYRFYLGTQAHTAKLIHEQGTLQVTATDANPYFIGLSPGSVGYYNISGGRLYCSGSKEMFVGSSGGEGHLNISGSGIVDCYKLDLSSNKDTKTGTKPKGYIDISDNGALYVRDIAGIGNYETDYAEVVQSGGTFAVTNNAQLNHGTVKYIKTGGSFAVGGELKIGGSENTANDKACNATLEQSGGSIVVSSYTQIGVYGTGTYAQSDGLFYCKNHTSIGRYSSGAGYCTVTGGTFTVTNVQNTVGLLIGEAGAGTLTVGETGVLAAGSVVIGKNSGSKGTLKLGGDGKIVTKSIKKGSGTATLVEFDGGTIQAMADEAAFLGNLGNIQLGAGGLTIDTQGYNLGITNCTFNVSSNSGKLNVVGGGTVTFTDVTVNVTDNPSQAITFAERTDGGTFEFEGGLPEFNYRDWKLRVSGDKKTVRLVPPGLVIVVM